MGRRQEGGEREEREKERKERWVSRKNKNPTLRMWGKKNKNTHTYTAMSITFSTTNTTQIDLGCPLFRPL